jgi:predicted nucleic acid-binding OB-fold protein
LAVRDGGRVKGMPEKIETVRQLIEYKDLATVSTSCRSDLELLHEIGFVSFRRGVSE